MSSLLARRSRQTKQSDKVILCDKSTMEAAAEDHLPDRKQGLPQMYEA